MSDLHLTGWPISCPKSLYLRRPLKIRRDEGKICMYSRTRLHCGFLSLKHNSTRNARAPGMEWALERTLWAHGTERPLERTIWAHGMERALEWAPLPWEEPVLECQLTVPTSWVDPPACVPAQDFQGALQLLRPPLWTLRLYLSPLGALQLCRPSPCGTPSTLAKERA